MKAEGSCFHFKAWRLGFMEAGNLDIQINQGAQFRLELTVRDEDDALIDLTRIRE